MSELSADVSVEDGSINLEIPYVKFLKSNGYKIDAISHEQLVASSSRDLQHARVTTYDEPFGSENLDLVEDEIELEVCSCEGFTYTHGADVSESLISPSQSKSCPHIRKAFKTVRAANDEQQETLE